MHKVLITPSAGDDLLDGFVFYEAHEAGVGDYFLQCLVSDIDSLGLYAGIHAKSHLGLYRTSSKRFPFSIYYQFDNSTVVVAAIIDERRSPKTIRRALSDRTSG